MSIEVTCKCGRLFVAPERLAGKSVSCLGCGRTVAITAAVTAPDPPPSSSMLAIRCACGQDFMAREEIAGKQVRCRACGRTLSVPKRTPPHTASRAAAPQLAAAVRGAERVSYSSPRRSATPESSPFPPATSGSHAARPPEAAPSQYFPPPFRRKKSNLVAVLAILAGVGILGLCGLVVGGVVLLSVIRGVSRSRDFQLPPPGSKRAVESPWPRHSRPRIEFPPSVPAASPTASRPMSSPPPVVPTENDAEFIAAVERFVGKLEQFAGELASVTDRAGAVAIERKMQDTAAELRLAQTDITLRSARTTMAATKRFITEFRPRIDEANRTILTEVVRINQLLTEAHNQRALTTGWGTNGPPTP